MRNITMTCKLHFFTFLMLLTVNANGSKIIILSVFGTKSTMLNFQNLAEHLARRGHQIIYVTGEKMVKHDPENISYVVLPFAEDTSFQANLFYTEATYNMYFWYQYLSWTVEQCEDYYDMKEVNQLRKEDKVDAVIFDYYVQDCFLPLAHSFKAPIIFYHGNVLDPVIENELAIPTPYSHTPSLFFIPTSFSNFWNRLLNAFVMLQLRVIQEWFYYPRIEEIANRRIPNSPKITDIMKNASMIMGTLDNVWTSPRPAMPFVVDNGGGHCRSPSPLPKELEDVIAESGEDGFILFAMGTYWKTESFPPGYLDIFLRAFSRLKQVILWKASSSVKNLPSNVKALKWLPQQNLLGHPKIRLFISHGGLYSIYEAIYNAVPVLGIGIFADQVDNIRVAEAKGIALAIDKHSVTEEVLYQGIITLLNNVSYKTNIGELSSALKDQMETPVERAVYWTEYVIRHKDVSFLHWNAKELNFIQYFSLVEISIIVSAIGLIVYVVYLLIALLKRKLSHS